jgi:hypothetical protein
MKSSKMPIQGIAGPKACIHCKGRLKLAKDAWLKQELLGETLFVCSPAYVCRQCGRQYLRGSQGDQLRHNIAEEYRRRHNLLSSAQIEDCRRRLKLSVREFARQLHTTPKNVRRWTTWLVQDKTTDQRIRRLFGPFKLQADCYERFLTGHMSARRLGTETGFADDANQLTHVLWGLQSAYDRLVQDRANCLLLQVLALYRSQKLAAREAEEFFGLNANAIKHLVPAVSGGVRLNSDSKAELQRAEGGCWSNDDLKRKFGFTAADLCCRRLGREILFWKGVKGAYFYPRWQFTKTGALLPGIARILQIFQSDDNWRTIRYFLTKRQSLENRRPLDLLRDGEIDRCLTHAQLHAAENNW